MNNTTSTDIFDNEDCHQIGFYVSLGCNALLAITTIVSEAMGSNKRSDKNGILDSILKSIKGYKVVKRTDEETTTQVRT